MWKTALLLIFTLILVPIITFQFDEPLSSFQLSTLRILLLVYAVAGGACFIISTLSKNYSQVDKLWSLIPIAYVWIVAYYGAFSERLLLMAILVTLWGIRLTYNFARRGGYSWRFWEGEEDYRWAVLQKRPEFQSSWRWVLFNLLFISVYQMGLILLFTLPILKSMGAGPLVWGDWVLAAIFIGLVVIETIADQQQWRFQLKKQQMIKTQKKLDGLFQKGFLDRGLWAWSRHPNYAAEQLIWICFYLFSVVATGVWINWSIAGCLLLLTLFKGSSDFSEAISAEKYPDYQEYQKKVARFIPFLKKPPIQRSL